MINLDKSEILQNFPIKKNTPQLQYLKQVSGIIEVCQLYADLKNQGSNLNQIKDLSARGYISNEKFENTDVRNKYLHNEEKEFSVSKDSKVIGTQLVRKACLQKSGVIQVKGYRLSVFSIKQGRKISKYIQQVERFRKKRNKIKRPNLLGSAIKVAFIAQFYQMHNLIQKQFISLKQMMYIIVKSQQAIRARDFVIFMNLFNKKKINRKTFEYCIEKFKTMMSLNFFFHLDYIARKLIDLGRKKQKEFEQDLNRQKTNSKDYRFPPLSSISSASDARKISIGKRSEQDSLPPPATLTNQQSSDKSHWVQDNSQFGQSQKISTGSMQEAQSNNLKEIIEAEMDDSNIETSRRQGSLLRQRAQTEKEKKKMNEKPEFSPPEDAIQYEFGNEKETILRFNLNDLQQTQPPVKYNEMATSGISNTSSQKKGGILKQTYLPTGYKVSFEHGDDQFHIPLKKVIIQEEFNSKSSGSLVDEGTISEVQIMDMKKIFSYVAPSKQKLKLNNRTFGGSQEEETQQKIFVPLSELDEQKLIQERANIIQANNYLYELYETCLFNILNRSKEKVLAIMLVGGDKDFKEKNFGSEQQSESQDIIQRLISQASQQSANSDKSPKENFQQIIFKPSPEPLDKLQHQQVKSFYVPQKLKTSESLVMPEVVEVIQQEWESSIDDAPRFNQLINKEIEQTKGQADDKMNERKINKTETERLKKEFEILLEQSDLPTYQAPKVRMIYTQSIEEFQRNKDLLEQEVPQVLGYFKELSSIFPENQNRQFSKTQSFSLIQVDHKQKKPEPGIKYFDVIKSSKYYNYYQKQRFMFCNIQQISY